VAEFAVNLAQGISGGLSNQNSQDPGGTAFDRLWAERFDAGQEIAQDLPGSWAAIFSAF
jgi:hypothetical protein